MTDLGLWRDTRQLLPYVCPLCQRPSWSIQDVLMSYCACCGSADPLLLPKQCVHRPSSAAWCVEHQTLEGRPPQVPVDVRIMIVSYGLVMGFIGLAVGLFLGKVLS